MKRSSCLALLVLAQAAVVHAWAQPNGEAPAEPVAPPPAAATTTGAPQTPPTSPSSKAGQPPVAQEPPTVAPKATEGRKPAPASGRADAAAFRRPPSSRSTLVVEIEGMRNDRGALRLALFEGAAGFPNEAWRARRASIVPIRGRRSLVVWSDLEPGSYAVAVLHDENRNGVLDKNWVGMPTEGSGFSRDATGSWGPPDYQDAAQLLVADRVSRTVIRVFYF